MRMLLVLSVVGGFARHSARSAARGGRSETCPPTCDRIPDTAWIPPWDIPLNSKYTWPPLQAVAVTDHPTAVQIRGPVRHGAVSAGPLSYAVAERATVANPEAQWQLQAQIFHWRGDVARRSSARRTCSTRLWRRCVLVSARHRSRRRR